MNRIAVGLDLGTTSIAAAAVDETGAVRARTTLPNSATLQPSLPGRAEQDPLQIRDLAVQALRGVAETLRQKPVCLGLTGQMHGVLLVDRARRPLTPLITWQDRRANEQGSSGASYLEEFRLLCSDSAIADAGCFPAPGYAAVTLFVLNRRGEIPPEAMTAAFLADWVRAELRDGAISTDRSNAASAGIYDLRRDKWSEELLAKTGLQASWFPPVRESGAALGGLSADAARATGLPAGLPVANAIGDNQAAFLGSGAGADSIQINIGTGGQISWPIADFQRVADMDTRYLPPGRFLLVGAGVSGGDAYAWVQRTAGRWLACFGHEATEEAIYERLGELAAQTPDDADGLTCEPLFRGSRQHPAARGMFHGVAFDNFSPGHVARAVLTGVVEGLYRFYERAGPLRPAVVREIVGTGNALRQNSLLRQLLTRRFGLPVRLTPQAEEAACGAARWALTALDRLQR